MSLSFQIDKLGESNYDVWSMTMQSVLVTSDLWDIVSGDSVKPEAAPDSMRWEKTDKKARACIILNVKPSQLLHIKNCVTSLQTWNKLKEVHMPDGPIQQVQLYQKLLRLRMQQGDSVLDYVNSFVEITNKLGELEISLPDPVKAVMLLASLPKSFEHFVVAIQTRDKLPAFEQLKSKLLEEGERHKASVENDDNCEKSAYSVRTENEKPKDKKKNNSYNGKKPIQCWSCGKRGHVAAKCNERKNAENKESGAREKSYSAVCLSSHKNEIAKSVWCVDSGATAHLCRERSCFTDYSEHKERILFADNKYIESEGRGTVRVVWREFVIKLVDVLYVKELQCNFMSVAKAIDNGFRVNFTKRNASVIESDGTVVLEAKRHENLFIFESTENKCLTAQTNASQLWHSRYGHLNFGSLNKMVKQNMVIGLKTSFGNDIVCETCAKSKICVKKFPKSSENRATEILDLVHSDICGPMNKKSIGGSRYFATFIDDKSRYVSVYFLKSRDEIFEKFKEFKALSENQSGKKIKAFRSDNGLEYVSGAFQEFLASNGINRQLTVPHTPQQNGVAERANRTLVEMARSMLLHAGLDERFWAEAIKTASYLRNRAETTTLPGVTPFEAWAGRKPCVQHLRVFGAKAIVLDKSKKKKFSPKGVPHILVGYSETVKGYRLYNPDKQKIISARDVVFMQNDLVANDFCREEDLAKEPECQLIEIKSPSAVVPEEEVEADATAHEPEGETAEPQGETEEIRRGPGRPKKILTGLPGRPRKEFNKLNSLKPEEIVAPSTYIQALNSDQSDSWKASLQKEMNSLQANKTWSLVDLPEGQKAIGCKWVFTLKRDKQGNIQSFKSRLVAKGCGQRPGINYFETFSPVARYSTIRLVIALAVEHGMFMHQMDVSSAYLNSNLHDEVYMRQPEGFVDEQFPGRVLRLHKSLYGLKQSGREWNEKLNAVLMKIGFAPCPSEPCLYVNKNIDRVSMIVVYVDDLIIASNSKDDLNKTKELISKEFDVVDGGSLKHFLGMEIERDGETGSVEIGHKQYIETLLNEYGMKDCKPNSLPLEAGHQIKCENDNCTRVNQAEYQSLIGSLLYLATTTRPDILHSTVKLAQCNADPHKEHLAAAKRMLRYLRGSSDVKLHYKRTGENICCFVDADWAGDSTNRKSYTGWAFFAAGAAFNWESKKQSVVSLSSTEAEYIGLSTAAREAAYIKKLVAEIGIGKLQTVQIYSDNQSAQCLAKNPTFHARSKHIDIKYHHVREMIKCNVVKIDYVPTEKMIADVLTKNLCKSKHIKCINAMGLF